MMDGSRVDTVSAVMGFLGVINSVCTGLFLMPFLGLNMFPSLPTTYFVLKMDSLGGLSFDCLLCRQKI